MVEKEDYTTYVNVTSISMNLDNTKILSSETILQMIIIHNTCFVQQVLLTVRKDWQVFVNSQTTSITYGTDATYFASERNGCKVIDSTNCCSICYKRER